MPSSPSETKREASDSEQAVVPAAPVSSNANRWGKYVFGIYMDQKPPLLGSVRAQRIAELTKEKLKDRPGTLTVRANFQ